MQWKQVAKRLGLSQAEINKMEPAFKVQLLSLNIIPQSYIISQ